jgi:hypothetical protein
MEGGSFTSNLLLNKLIYLIYSTHHLHFVICQRALFLGSSAAAVLPAECAPGVRMMRSPVLPRERLLTYKTSSCSPSWLHATHCSIRQTKNTRLGMVEAGKIGSYGIASYSGMAVSKPSMAW